MPRNVSGAYTVPPGSTATTLTTISASAHNTLIADLEADANTPRPIVAGGTGASTADTALTNLGGTATGKGVFTAASQAAAQAAIGAHLPAGAVMHFAMSSAPTGWLKANGAAVSRTTYAALFANIGTLFGGGDGTTTFNLPDLRGEFVRSWDDGRTVDNGRLLGSAQAAAMLDHTHTGTTSSAGDHIHNITGQIINGNGPSAGISAASTAGTNLRNTNTTEITGAHTHTLTTGNPSAGGGNETRPRNVALLACIKF